MRKGIIAPILLIVVFLAGIGVAAVYFQSKSKSTVQLPPPSPSAQVAQNTSADETAKWKTYQSKNAPSEIEFSHPIDWTLMEEESGIFLEGAQGQINIDYADYGFAPNIENFVEQKKIVVDLKNSQLSGTEFIYSNSGFFVAAKYIGSQKCVCIRAIYNSPQDRSLVTQIIQTVEIK